MGLRFLNENSEKSSTDDGFSVLDIVLYLLAFTVLLVVCYGCFRLIRCCMERCESKKHGLIVNTIYLSVADEEKTDWRLSKEKKKAQKKKEKEKN